MTRSKPAAFITAMTVSRCSGTSWAPRVARLRKKIRSPSSELASDPVAQQGAAALAAGRVDGDHGDAELVLLVDAEAAYELVGQRLTCPSRRCR